MVAGALQNRVYSHAVLFTIGLCIGVLDMAVSALCGCISDNL